MKEYVRLAMQNQRRAYAILSESNIPSFLEQCGCRVNLIGSLAMGLLVKHLDIDLHVYSSDITEESSFAIFAQIAKDYRVKEIKCINGLHTDEQCMAWHLSYEDTDRRVWQIDIIHIESGSKYDGYFERMARLINERLSDGERETIIRLKYETPDNETIHGVEYYQAVMEDKITTMADLRAWIKSKRKDNGCYWSPD